MESKFLNKTINFKDRVKDFDLDLELGRLVFGNLSKFSNNRQGRAILRKSRKMNINLSQEQHKIVKNFKLLGIYKPPFLADPDILSRVKKLYLQTLSASNRSTSVISQLAFEEGIPPFCFAVSSEVVPELELLITTPIKETIDVLLGKNRYKLNFVTARRTHYVPEDIEKKYDVYSNTWHFDVEPCNRIKLFIALSDIDENCGPFHVFDRPSSRKILRKGFKNRDDYGIDPNMLANSKLLTKMTGSIGTCFFTSVTQCLHKAGIPKKGRTRDIVEFQFEAIA